MPGSNPNDERVLVLAPIGCDGPVTAKRLREGGFAAEVCADTRAAARQLAAGAGALLLTQEALEQAGVRELFAQLHAQPPWSELPLIVLTRADEPRLPRLLERAAQAAGAITLLERPLGAAALLRTIEVALRSRRRQYQVRDLLEQERRHNAALQAARTAALQLADDAKRAHRQAEQAAAALRESEQRLALAVSGARIGMFEWDITTGKSLCSEQFARLMGLRTSTTTTTTTTTLSLEDQHRDWTRRIHPEDLPRMEAELRRCMTRHRPYAVEYRVVWPDKSVLWIAGRGVFLYDAKGKPNRVLGIIIDISERKRAEELWKELNARLENRVAERTQELTLANQRLQAVMDTALVGILTLDERGVVKFVNPAAARIFGYAPSEMFEAEVSRLIASPSQPQQESFLSHFLQSSRKPASGAIDWVLGRHRDGHVIILEFTLVEFAQPEGRQFVAMVRDITARKRLERELLEITERERQRIGRDLHDGLGQQLHGLSYLTALLEQRLKEEASSCAAEVARMNKYLTEALEMTRSLAHGLQPVKSVPEGLMTALRELAERTGALYRIDCRFECRTPVLIRRPSAAHHLYRIAQEAVNNAMKHAKPTRVRIALAATPQRLVLGIRDNGAGIRRATARPRGMGLHVMQYRADAISGSLVVQRLPAGGTAVVCTVSREALLRQEENNP